VITEVEEMGRCNAGKISAEQRSDFYVPNYVKRDGKKVENTKFLRSEKDIIRLKTL